MARHRERCLRAWLLLPAACALAAGCSATRDAPADGRPATADAAAADLAGDATSPVSPYRAAADRAMVALEALYLKNMGLFGFGWWTSANAVETTIDYSRLTGSTDYLYIVSNTFDVHATHSPLNKSPSFINEYYDDEGWWALTWIKAYDLTGEARYLAMAQTIFDDLVTGWDDVCGGGVWWSKERSYKNAIPNELFLTIAARLHQRTSTDGAPTEYRVWAERTWQWFAASGMINAESQVNDGLDAECRNNGQTPWTYNQGVILGGLVELWRITEDAASLEQARAIADAAIAKLVTPRGILTESCEPDCGEDGTQFKGIFMRYLGQLFAATGSAAYAAFIERNAGSIRDRAMNADGAIGLMWDAAFDRSDPQRQSSGLDALNAALAVSAAGAR